MAAFSDGITRILAAYEPYPCLVVDRGWNLVRANAGIEAMLVGVAPHLLEAPNALRLSLHPDGLAPRIRNLGEWRHHVLGRLAREVGASGSDTLRELLDELSAYPGGSDGEVGSGDVAVTLQLDSPAGPLSLQARRSLLSGRSATSATIASTARGWRGMKVVGRTPLLTAEVDRHVVPKVCVHSSELVSGECRGVPIEWTHVRKHTSNQFT